MESKRDSERERENEHETVAKGTHSNITNNTRKKENEKEGFLKLM